MLWFAAALPIGIAWGAWRGARRLLFVLLGTTAGALAAPAIAPALSDLLARVTGSNSWAGVIAAWIAIYLAVATLAVFVVGRWFPGHAAMPHGAAFRTHGAAVGAVCGALITWCTLGNLPELALRALPEQGPEAMVDLRRPFEVLHVCRIFGSLSAEEADHLAGRPEVSAVVDNPAMEKLLQTPGVLRKVSRAAEGDWTALGALAADESVNVALHDPIFLERVRQVDLLALADAIERRRAAGEGPAIEAPGVERLPAFARSPEFVARAEREWSDSPVATTSAPRDPADRAREAEAYWRNVGTVLEWYEGRSTVASILADPLLSAPPPSVPPSEK